jgi:hypothetical protein
MPPKKSRKKVDEKLLKLKCTENESVAHKEISTLSEKEIESIRSSLS